MNSHPPVEVWRLKAEEWVDLDAAAFLLMEGKTTVLERYKAEHIEEGMSAAAAERKVKTSDAWADYLKKMCAARKRALHAKVGMQYAERMYWEGTNKDANVRAEKRMTR